MIFKWKKLQIVLNDCINYKNHIATLLTHDIDILFISQFSNQYFLNFLIDEDEDQELLRYLYVPISTMKLRALVTGGATLYECLKVDNVFVYDLYQNTKLEKCYSLAFKNIDENALPNKDELLPPISETIVKKIYGFDTGKLSFILSGETVANHTISFEKLSKFLLVSQNLASDTTQAYCAENNLKQPSNLELRAEAQQAASFAITTKAHDDIIIEALNATMSKYTKNLLTSTPSEIYKLLDEVSSIDFLKSLFAFYSIVLSNKYESIIKTEKQSFYLNTDKVKQIKKSVNDAKYARQDHITATGYLLGGNIRTRYFYFFDKETKTSLSGKISEDYPNSHTLDLSDKKIRTARFKRITKIKFNNFIHTYELIELN